jgi:hypothetical protein
MPAAVPVIGTTRAGIAAFTSSATQPCGPVSAQVSGRKHSRRQRQ